MVFFSRALMTGVLLTVPLIAAAENNSLILPQLTCELPVTSQLATDTTAIESPATVTASAQQLNLCQQLAKTGNADAQFQLGQYFEQQPEADLAKAIDWYEQASLQGHATAQWRLGLLFFNGQGVASNKVQSFIVLKMAAINGEEQAIDAADEVADSMHSEELALANQLLSQIFYNYMQELTPEALPAPAPISSDNETPAEPEPEPEPEPETVNPN